MNMGGLSRRGRFHALLLICLLAAAPLAVCGDTDMLFSCAQVDVPKFVAGAGDDFVEAVGDADDVTSSLHLRGGAICLYNARNPSPAMLAPRTALTLVGRSRAIPAGLLAKGWPQSRMYNRDTSVPSSSPSLFLDIFPFEPWAPSLPPQPPATPNAPPLQPSYPPPPPPTLPPYLPPPPSPPPLPPYLPPPPPTPPPPPPPYPSPPPAPTSPIAPSPARTPPSSPWSLLPNYTIVDWFYVRKAAIRIAQGQNLTLRSMAFVNEYKDFDMLTGNSQSTLTFAHIAVEPNAVLRLEDITLVINCTKLYSLLQTLCIGDPDPWSYSADVEIEDGIMRIRTLTSRAPGLNGTVAGAGGLVQWANVTITCMAGAADKPAPLRLTPPLPCAAVAVSDGRELYQAARRVLEGDAAGTVFVSLTADAVALPNDGSWEPPIQLQPGQQLVLLGDPRRSQQLGNTTAHTTVFNSVNITAMMTDAIRTSATTPTILDLFGLPDVLILLQSANESCRALKPPPLQQCRLGGVLMRDLVLVNLPLPVQPTGPMSLLAAALSSIGFERANAWSGDAVVRLERSTIVVPDPELDFLAGVIGRNNSDVWPGEPQGSFNFMVETKQQVMGKPSSGNGNDGTLGELAIRSLGLMSDVLLTNCTLLSTSSYPQLPGAVQLLPASRLWAPQLLAARDPDTAERWGPGGLAVFLGLQQALASFASSSPAACGSTSGQQQPPGYNPTRLLWKHDDDTVVPAIQLALSSAVPATTTKPSCGGRDGAPPAPAPAYIVDGSPTSSPLPLRGSGRRVFSDLKGGIANFALTGRPLKLQNLVLYNLAPGGLLPGSSGLRRSTQEASSGWQPLLNHWDAAWENSSLPLWFFALDRHTDARNTTKQAQQPLLVMQNVTLVVPERDWRALVAAVLLTHAPKAMLEAQQQRLRLPRPPPRLPPPRPAHEPVGQAAGSNDPPAAQYPVATGVADPVSSQGPPQSARPPMHPPMAPSSPAPPPVPPAPFPPLPVPPQHPPPPAPPPPRPPSPSRPPPSPPYSETTRSTMLGFAEISQVSSYNYRSGELVLTAACHYGWVGTNVTITYKMPQDAPGTAKLLSYPELVLPYDDLADLDIDLPAELLSSDSQRSGNKNSSSSGGTENPTPPPPQQQPVPPLPQGTDMVPKAINLGAASGIHPRPWVTHLVAALIAVIGAFLIAGLITALLVLRRLQRNKDDGTAADGKVGTTAGLQPRRSSSRDLPAHEGDRVRGEQWPQVVVACWGGTHFQHSSGSGRVRGRAGAATSAARGGGAGEGARGGEADSLGKNVSVLSAGRASSDVDPTTACGFFSGAFHGWSSQRPMTEDALSEGTAASPTAGPVVLARRPPDCRTLGRMAQANRAAMAHALAMGRTGRGGSGDGSNAPMSSLPRAAAVVTLTSAASSGLAPMQWGTDGTDGRIHLQEFNAYFSKLRSIKQSSASRQQNQSPPAATVMGAGEDELLQERSQQEGEQAAAVEGIKLDLRTVIRTIQAEMQDPQVHLEDAIGLGAFGVVYRGTWRGLPVAVKTLLMSNAQLAAGGNSSREGLARQRAVLEAAISMSMSHPNVVATYAFDIKTLAESPTETAAAPATGPSHGGNEEHNDAFKLFIVQEYCAGGSLGAVLDYGLAGCVQADGEFGLLGLRLAADVARGMHHIHSCRIVHGDLKPYNVLLAFSSGHDDDGPISPRDLVAKVADFGLSVALSEDATHASKMFHGTPAYLAPEVAAAGQLSPRADVWSFGLMLIELYFGCSLSVVRQFWANLTGSVDPHGGGSSLLQTMRAFLGDVLASIPDRPYAGLAARCLSLDPRERPEFGEIAAALQTMCTARDDTGRRHGGTTTCAASVL